MDWDACVWYHYYHHVGHLDYHCLDLGLDHCLDHGLDHCLDHVLDHCLDHGFHHGLDVPGSNKDEMDLIGYIFL